MILHYVQKRESQCKKQIQRGTEMVEEAQHELSEQTEINGLLTALFRKCTWLKSVPIAEDAVMLIEHHLQRKQQNWDAKVSKGEQQPRVWTVDSIYQSDISKENWNIIKAAGGIQLVRKKYKHYKEAKELSAKSIAVDEGADPEASARGAKVARLC